MQMRAALLALALVPGVARAAEPPCLSSAEFTALAGYGLPSAIAGTSQRCAATLPADAFLRTQGPALIARYATAKPAMWPAAKAAFFKLGIAAPPEAMQMLRALPDASQQQLVDIFVAGIVAEKLPVEHCATFDRLLALLSLLPPESTAEAIGLAAGIGSRAGQARIGKIVICTP